MTLARKPSPKPEKVNLLKKIIYEASMSNEKYIPVPTMEATKNAAILSLFVINPFFQIAGCAAENIIKKIVFAISALPALEKPILISNIIQKRTTPRVLTKKETNNASISNRIFLIIDMVYFVQLHDKKGLGRKID